MPECPTCDKELRTEHGVKQHHTKVHGESIAGVEVDCDFCEGTIRRSQSEIGKRNFCSRECQYNWVSENMSGENHPMWNGGKKELECKNCGDKYKRTPSRVDESSFCSAECQAQWRSENWVGENCPFYDGGLEKVPCEWCDNIVKRKPSHVGKRNFCSTECQSKWRSENIVGKKHPNWKGGHTEYRGEDWNKQRRKAIKRDGGCMFCGMSMGEHTMIYGSELEVHHVTPWRISKSNDLSNLITLCKACHLRFEGKTHRENRNT